jgi:RCR-type E3 ubiquitin transferase
MPEYPQLWLALGALMVAGDQGVTHAGSPNDGPHGMPPTPRSWAMSLLAGDPAAKDAAPECSNCGWSTGIRSKMRCDECEPSLNLCESCDRVLHLPRAKRAHRRSALDTSAKLEFQGSMARIKLPTCTTTVDTVQAKAVVECTMMNVDPTAPRCRFCATVLLPSTTAKAAPIGCASLDGKVCSSAECSQLRDIACTRTHPCGHPCGGARGEEICLPCLQCGPEAAVSMLPEGAVKPLVSSGEEFCAYCMYPISSEPAILLSCGHVHHLRCLRKMLSGRWSGSRIDFGFRGCPSCRAPIVHPYLGPELEPIDAIYADVKRKALLRLEYEGLEGADELQEGGEFVGNPAGYALTKFAYYLCYKCNRPYFGGGVQCEVPGQAFDPSELVCGSCSHPGEVVTCNKHGDDFLEYKCRYCCSVAVWFCFGTTHFCNTCHTRPEVGA